MSEEQAVGTESVHKVADAPPAKIEIDVLKLLTQLGIEEDRWPLEIMQKRTLPDHS